MKKRKGFIIAVLIGVLILAGIIITVWTAYMRKSFPQEASYCIFDVYAGNENGLYYSKNNILYYLDRATQEIVPVCAKPDCNHTSDTCNAYYGGIGPNIMLYGEYIFVSYFMVDYNVNEEEKKLEIDSTSYLECCRLDGSDRKIIFQSDNGSVTNMMARDGKLYFTGFSYQSELAEEKMDYDNYLYCYDMVWGTTKTLLHYKWDELHNNAGLELIKNMDGKEIFLQYGYEDKEGNRESMVLQYMGKDQTKEIFSASKGNPIPESTKMYVQNDVFYTNNARNDWDMCCFASIKPDGTMEEMAVVPEGDIGINGSYVEIGISNSRRMLYDLSTGEYYISKALAGLSDKVVPDLILALKDEDICYYDSTDYTGKEAGYVFTEDPTEPASMSWKEYLETHFVPYEGQESELFTIYE